MKKILLMLAEGFEEIEALSTVDILRRANVSCVTCSLSGDEVSGAHCIKVLCDEKLENINEDNFDGIILPGGMPGATNLRDNKKVIEIIKKYNDENKLIAAICAAPIVLSKAGIIDGKTITSYPGFEDELKEGKYKNDLVSRDNNIITSRGPATTMLFAFEILDYLGLKKEVEELKSGMLFNEFLNINSKN